MFLLDRPLLHLAGAARPRCTLTTAFAARPMTRTALFTYCIAMSDGIRPGAHLA